MVQCRCPICHRVFEMPDNWPMPFCTERCQSIDLGRWLGEKHSLPVLRTADDEDEQAGPTDPDGD